MAPMARIVLKVDLPNDRKKVKALKTIASLSGVDSIAVDIRDQKITVIGHVDPVDIVYNLRKLVAAHIVSVGRAPEAPEPWPMLRKEEPSPLSPAEEKPCPPPPKPPPPKPYLFQFSPDAEEFTYGFLNCITNNFSEDRIIGQSRYGTVYKGVRDNGKCIAVMKLLHQIPILEGEFKNEIRKLTWVQHPNTVQLVGYCYHMAQVSVKHEGEYVSARVEERALCFEYLKGPTLEEHLSKEPCGLHWHTCYMIIMGICKGLRYLHSPFHNGPHRFTIDHLDLKPTNILMDRYMMPKIGGFGLSRIFGSLTTKNIPEETSVYVPPEYINGYETSRKVDVFSLGVIIIQIMAGKESYPKCVDTPEEFIQFVHEFWAKRMPETIWRRTSSEVMACIKIALQCVKSDPVTRPTITDIINILDIKKIYTANQLYNETREFTLNFLKGITNDFSMQNKVGHGGHADVYKGVLDNGEEIAVKKLTDRMPWIYEPAFKNELNNLTRAQHNNIVPLVGYCCHAEQTLVDYEGKNIWAFMDTRVLCLEYLPGGSLDEHISDDEACKLDWDTCYRIIKGICEGLNYLHNESGQRIYHRDLKPQNILLDKDMMPKISDFGLSRLVFSSETYKTQSDYVEGTRGYMPPEYITGKEVSKKFDIYSLGVIIIQMMAGKGYDSDCADSSPEEFVQHVHGNWLKRLHPSTVSNHASQEVMACIKIALRCVKKNRKQRPDITEIISELANIGTDESLLKATTEGDQLEVLEANNEAGAAGHELQVTPETPKELSVLRAFGQRIQQSCRRMAFKMSCMSSAIQDVALPAPAVTVTSGAQRTALSSQCTLIHFDAGSSSHSNSRATTSSAARAQAGALVDRGKGKQVEVTVDSKDEDATFVADEIGTSQLRDTPPVSQPTPPHGRRRG